MRIVKDNVGIDSDFVAVLVLAEICSGLVRGRPELASFGLSEWRSVQGVGMAKTPISNTTLQALSYAWQFGYTIVVPLVVLALLGRYLDRTLHTSPWFLLGGILLSIIISSVAVVMKALRIFRSVGNDRSTTQSNDKEMNNEE